MTKTLLSVGVGGRHLARLVLAGMLLGVIAPTLGATLNTNRVIAAAKESVAHDFKDPSSAQFRDVRIVITNGEKNPKEKIHAVCGEVNAKNSFGAYTGFKRFVAAATVDLQSAALGTADPAMVEGLWPKWCMTEKDKADAIAAGNRTKDAVEKTAVDRQAKEKGERDELRKIRQENIERTCAEKRAALTDDDAKAALDAQCAASIKASNAN